MRQAVLQIGEKVIRATGVTLTDEPTRHEFGIGIQSNPRPYVAVAFGFHICTAILLFRSDEAPNFVALDTLALKVTKRLVLEMQAGRAEIAQKLVHRVARDACHSGRCPNRIAFDESRNDLRPLLAA